MILQISIYVALLLPLALWLRWSRIRPATVYLMLLAGLVLALLPLHALLNALADPEGHYRRHSYKMKITPYSMEQFTGSLSWRFFDWGVISNSSRSTFSSEPFEGGMVFDGSKNIISRLDLSNPTPFTLCVLLIGLSVISHLVSSKSGTASWPARLSWIAGLVLIAAAISYSHPEKPLAVPGVGKVRSVKVYHLEEPVWEREIRDPRRIGKILAHLRKYNTGYRSDTRLHDFIFGSRRHEYTFIFNGEDGLPTPLIVWIGPDWLEGQDFRRGEPWSFRHRRLSASELKDLLAMVVRDET